MSPYGSSPNTKERHQRVLALSHAENCICMRHPEIEPREGTGQQLPLSVRDLRLHESILSAHGGFFWRLKRTALCRCRFYRQHNIGYLARPPHDAQSGGFKRRGRFKKASNMNFCLSVAKRVAAVCLCRSLESCMAPALVSPLTHQGSDQRMCFVTNACLDYVTPVQ